MDRVRSCAGNGKAVDRFLAEACAKDELLAAAGARIDGLDGMIGKRVAARPDPQRLAAATPRDRLAGVVEDELVFVRTEVQIIRRKVFVG